MPKFKKIENTEIYYAINTPYSVIRIGKMYYLCHEAAWYAANTPLGPWIVSTSIPQVIYTIPPSYPIYNVTYVHVFDYTPTYVYVGYYPGYVGSYVYGGTVVYGTGYVYPAWHGTVYYAMPVTWGYSVHYSSYSGVWAVRVGYPAPGVWYAGRAVLGLGRLARRDYWRDEYEDRRDRRDEQQDRRDERGERERDERDERERYERGDRERPEERRDRASIDKQRKNNVYSDRNGNAHRKTEKGWQQRSSSGWSKPDASTRQSSGRSGASTSDLNRQSHAREMGSNRTKAFQRSGRSGGSRGSGSSRGGGSRRGR